MTVTVFPRLDDLKDRVGEVLGTSDWLEIDQARIDRFAEATGDHQWIHVDPQRAAAGPFGTTIAHGFLTLSLLPVLAEACYRIEDSPMGINYGLNRVRFTSPVPVNSRVRLTLKLLAFEPIDGGAQLTCEAVIEREGQGRPVCVAESIARRYR
jgi:acyl dehydratase